MANTLYQPDLDGAGCNTGNSATDSNTAVTLCAVEPAQNDGKKEVVFIMDNVADWQTLVAGVKPGTAVVLLDSRSDGLAQMADYLHDKSGLDAIHLISHGSSGSVDLGSLKLDSADLNDHAATLSTIGSSLKPEGDLLLYGCNVAQGQTGVDFIGRLAQATGADVAASDDLTGASSLGGDWVLEYVAGEQSTRPDPVIEPLNSSGFAGTLTTNTFDFSSVTTGTANGRQTISQTVAGVTATVSSNVNDVKVDDYGNFDGTSGNVANNANGDDTAEVTTLTVTFSSATNVTSLVVGTAYGDTDAKSEYYVLTPSGGTNSAVNTSIANIDNNTSTVTVNWTGVTSFTFQRINHPTDSSYNNSTLSSGNQLGGELYIDTIIFDTAPSGPTVTSVSASTANGSYNADDTISITVTFSEAVTVTGTPQLTLETGTTDRVASYAGGSGTATLSFTYTVQAGDTSADLDYLNTTALALNGGTINATTGGTAATLTLASPGAANSLGNNKAIIIDTTTPGTPSAPDLDAGSDSGSSSTDNITSDTTPTLTGTAEAGATVTLYDTDGTTVLGSTTATGGNWSITSSTLAAGNHTLTTKATDTAGNTSAASTALAVTIDTAAPSWTSSATPASKTVAATRSGNNVLTLDSTDDTAVTYSLVVGNGTNDADNGKFTINGTTLKVGNDHLAVGDYHTYLAATDAAGNVAYQALTLSVTNTDPTLDLNGAASGVDNAVSVLEAKTSLAALAIVNDPENQWGAGSSWGGSMSISRTDAVPSANDQFEFAAAIGSNHATTVGDIFDGTFTISGTKVADWMYTGGSLSIMFTSAATNANVQTIVRSIGYQNSTLSDDATINIAIQDGDGSNNVSADVVVTQISLLDLNGANAGIGNTVTLPNAAQGLATLQATVADCNDAWNTETLTVQRTTSGTADASANDIFSFISNGTFTASGGNLSDGSHTFATYTNNAGVLTVNFNTLATDALVQDVVRHVGYSNATPYGDATISMSLSNNGTTNTANVAVTSNTIHVTRTDNDSDGDAADGFSLIEALAIARDGDTILLADGTYRGQYSISKAITLDAANGVNGHVIFESPNTAGLTRVMPDMLTNDGHWRMPVINVNTLGSDAVVTIRNITVDGRDQAVVDGFNGNKDMLGIGIVDSNAVIDNVIIKNIRSNEAANQWGYSENFGILAEAGPTWGKQFNVTISNSSIFDYQKTGIVAWGSNLHVNVTNNQITGVGLDGECGQNGMQIGSLNPGDTHRSGTTGTISGNVITNLSFENNQYGATGIILRDTGDVTVTNNSVSGPVNGLGNVAGIGLSAGSATQHATFVISGNSFSDVDYGIHNETSQGTIVLEIGENDFSGAVYAVLDAQGGVPYGSTPSTTVLHSTHAPTNGSKLLYLLFDGNDSFTDTGSVAAAVYGGGGADTISMGSGNDLLSGGSGNDVLTGGQGQDIFIYSAPEPYPGDENGAPMYNIGISDLGIDTITDFGTGDLIRVTGRASTGGTVTVGDGTTVAANSIQLAVSGGTTTLYIDTDNTADAAELEIHLTGTYTAANFRLDGTDICYVAPNSAPTLGSIPGSTQQVTTAVVAALPDFTVADTDGGTLTVTLTAANGTIGGLTDADPATPGIQLTGTAAQINTALADALFTATAAGAASIGFSLSDGVAAAVTATYNLNATAPVVNPPVVDPPVVNPPVVDPPVVNPPVVNPPTDDDNDGISATTENQVPTLPPVGGGTAVVGDGNGDGVADNQQSSVTSVPFLKTDTAVSNPTGAPPVYVTLVADSNAGVTDTTDTNSAQLTSVQQKDAPTDLPADIQMPLGLISFVATIETAGISETFSLFVDSSISFNGYWKQNTAGTWCNIATAIETAGGKTRIDFAITDGGEFDADGLADGIITDPGAIGSMPLSLVGELPVSTGTGFWF